MTTESIGVLPRTVYDIVSSCKTKAESRWLISRIVRGAIFSESIGCKRLSEYAFKIFAAGACLTLPLFSIVSLTGASGIIYVNYESDGQEFSNLGHLPEWIVAAVLYTATSYRIVKGFIAESDYIDFVDELKTVVSSNPTQEQPILKKAKELFTEIEKRSLVSKSWFDLEGKLLKG